MKKSVLRFALVSVGVVAIAGPATAGHRWSTYHWSKSSAEIAPPVGDNVTSAWDSYLRVAVNGNGTAAANWNDSSVIESAVVAGGTSARRCKAAAGRIEVCNLKYGKNGWLGIAGISISGGHITSGYTKLNDTYFNMAQYNTPAWRRMVMCQEIGHDYGLGHVNEAFDDPNTGSCMDYSNDPSRDDGLGTNEYPNAHDYEELETIYAHLEQSTTDFGERKVGKPAAPGASDAGIEGGNSPADWGRAVAYDRQGRPHIFEKNEGGRKIVTHVFWVPGFRPEGSRPHDTH